MLTELITPGPAASAEFVAVWIEEAQCWRVILGDGYVMPASFPAIGYAAGAALDRLGLGEADFDVTGDTGTFYRYQRTPESPCPAPSTD